MKLKKEKSQTEEQDTPVKQRRWLKPTLAIGAALFFVFMFARVNVGSTVAEESAVAPPLANEVVEVVTTPVTQPEVEPEVETPTTPTEETETDPVITPEVSAEEVRVATEAISI